MTKSITLEEALVAFWEALDRQPNLSRREWLNAHPDYAPLLKNVVDTERELERLKGMLTPIATVPNKPPVDFHRYKLQEELGRGGMGVVYRAAQPDLHREVAIKLMRGGPFASSIEKQRFQLEAETAAKLNHPNIVPVYDVGAIDGYSYIASQLMSHGALPEFRGKHSMTPRQAAEMARHLADALDHAHQRGVLHRDLKPANVLFDEHRRPHLADFGLAKLLNVDSGLTQTGETLGTPAYQAPELLTEKRVEATITSDVYGLGTVLYFAITGQAPFFGLTPLAVIHEVRNSEPTPPHKLAPGLSLDLEAIVLKCMDKKPAQRYQSAVELRTDLDRYLAGKPVKARHLTHLEKGVRLLQRHPWAASLITIALGSLAFLVAFLIIDYLETQQHDKQMTLAAEKQEQLQLQAQQAHYRSALLLANDLHQRGQHDRLAEILMPFIPSCGQRDLRGFDWHMLWKVARTNFPLVGHYGAVHSMAFSADGQQLASSGTDQTIRVWSIPEARELFRLPSEPHRYADRIALSTTGRYLAIYYRQAQASSLQPSIVIWDCSVTPPRALHTAAWPEALHIVETGFVKDDRLVILLQNEAKGSLLEWAPASNGWQELRKVEGHYQAMSLAPEQGIVTTARSSENGAIVESHGQASEPRELFRTDFPIHRMAWSGQGNALAAVSKSGQLLVWSLASKQARYYEGLRGEHFDFQIAWHQGKLAFTRHFAERKQDEFGLLDVAAMKVIARQSISSCWCMTGNRQETLIARDGDEAGIRVVQPITSELSHKLPGHEKEVWDVAFDPQQRWLASASDDATVGLWTLDTKERLGTLKGHESLVMSLVFLQGGSQLVTGSWDGTIALWSVPEGRIIRRWNAEQGHVARVCLSSQGLLASMGRQGSIKLWNTHTLELEQTIPCYAGMQQCLAFSPDGSLLAFRSEKSQISIVKVRDGAKVRDFVTSGYPASCLFTQDGQHVLVGMDTGLVLCQQVSSESIAWRSRVPVDCITTMTLTPDGGLLMIAGKDGVIRCMSTSTGHILLTLNEHAAPVMGLSFSSHGNVLASGSHDGSIRLWSAK
jgi:WD40 repeat protein